jgi:hypothetical protein
MMRPPVHHEVRDFVHLLHEMSRKELPVGHRIAGVIGLLGL